MPSHAERRKAIPAVTPALPFSTLDSVTRDAFNAFAALVIVMSSGIHSSNTSPGCAGLCILLMVRALSVMFRPIPQGFIYASLPTVACSPELLQYLRIKAKCYLLFCAAT